MGMTCQSQRSRTHVPNQRMLASVCIMRNQVGFWSGWRRYVISLGSGRLKSLQPLTSWSLHSPVQGPTHTLQNSHFLFYLYLTCHTLCSAYLFPLYFHKCKLRYLFHLSWPILCSGLIEPRKYYNEVPKHGKNIICNSLVLFFSHSQYLNLSHINPFLSGFSFSPLVYTNS